MFFAQEGLSFFFIPRIQKIASEIANKDRNQELPRGSVAESLTLEEGGGEASVGAAGLAGVRT